MLEKKQNIPQHVAIIMDGNGRWAEQRGESRSYGHMNGVQSVREAVKSAVKSGVRYLTLYAFSTENWGRPQEEIDALMELLCKSIIQESEQLQKQGVRIETIGNLAQMSEKVQNHLSLIKQQTLGGDKLTLILALNYSSREELVSATKLLSERVLSGELKPQDIDYTQIERGLYTSEFADPDLVIRTSGECRLSNFLLLQASYAELYFMDVLWPDFRDEHFQQALNEYSNRSRRFGLVK
ncbi:MAG: polyprenyl diphosphate synthase [Rikenellaceae bacterium]